MFRSIVDVVAQGNTGGGPSILWLFGGMIVLMYFFMIRPQSKEKKAHQAMLEAVKTGDKIVTVGGIYGIVTNVKDVKVVVKVADSVKLEIRRSGIARVINAGDEDKEEGR